MFDGTHVFRFIGFYACMFIGISERGFSGFFTSWPEMRATSQFKTENDMILKLGCPTELT